jgi:hypothetical protein
VPAIGLAGNQMFLDWSRDGARIVFVTEWTSLWVADADGANAEQVYLAGPAIGPPLERRITSSVARTTSRAGASGSARCPSSMATLR